MAWWVFQNIAVTAVLAIVVAAACRARRLGPVARHALWVLVLVKFVTPPLVAWPWAAPDPWGVSVLDVRLQAPPTDVAPVLDQPQAVDRTGEHATASDPAEVARRDLPDRSAARTAAMAWRWLVGMWAAGSLWLVVIEGARLARLNRRVRAARPANPALVNRVTALSSRLGVRPVPVLVITGIASPVLWCLGRPRLLWPAELPPGASDACIDGWLVHELAHVKRRDHLVGWVELVAGVVWWWNPLFWFVRSSLREQAELACDAWVISALPNGRRAYAESLLALSGATWWTAPSMAVIGVRATSRRVLERRLVMIMKGRVPLQLRWGGLLCLALMAAATLPAWAASQQPPPPPPPVPVVVPAEPQNPPPPPPPPPPAPRARSVRQIPPPPRPPTPRIVELPNTEALTVYVQRADLPADGRQLLEGFETDRAAIQKEADQKVAARRAELVKALEDLQAQYTKAGKLDDALAIREYLRTGLPRTGYRYVIRRDPK